MSSSLHEIWKSILKLHALAISFNSFQSIPFQTLTIYVFPFSFWFGSVRFGWVNSLCIRMCVVDFSTTDCFCSFAMAYTCFLYFCAIIYIFIYMQTAIDTQHTHQILFLYPYMWRIRAKRYLHSHLHFISRKILQLMQMNANYKLEST